ncbi:MAG: hypothetical protein Q4B94_00290 [Pseudomonadota bacterium]|nr:hypothetical protein [Pseudomonadota bacterium]
MSKSTKTEAAKADAETKHPDTMLPETTRKGAVEETRLHDGTVILNSVAE